jgi:hypothetical protein
MGFLQKSHTDRPLAIDTPCIMRQVSAAKKEPKTSPAINKNISTILLTIPPKTPAFASVFWYVIF